MPKNLRKRISVIIIIIGVLILVYPYFLEIKTKQDMKQTINEFISTEKKQDSKSNRYLEELYLEMEKYNDEIAFNGQNIIDAFSYNNIDFDLSKYGLKENIIGTINIPKINIELPLYLGSTKENLNKGATILGQTSMPLGKTNSNTVIAAHRGLAKHQMFRHIDKLEIGDEVKLTTLWDELYYEVKNTKIIDPSEYNQVLIEKGKDKLTLITCHPYRINTQRYVVYCERK